MIRKKGEVWRVVCRKGKLLIRLLENVNVKKDGFFEGKILEGRAQYMSIENNLEQKLNGKGTKGTTISFRTTLTTWLKRFKSLELQEPRP